MSYAILSLCGIDAPQAVAASLLNALYEACNLRQPLSRYALLVTPEHARLARRIEIVDEWAAMSFFGLAKRLARFSTRGDELLVISIGDDLPKVQTISLAPVRAAFTSIRRKETV
jgi:hypothetical protein